MHISVKASMRSPQNQFGATGYTSLNSSDDSVPGWREDEEQPLVADVAENE